MLLYKLQIGCLIIFLVVTFCYVWDRMKYGIKGSSKVFDFLLVISFVNLILDLATVYSVNHLEEVPSMVNKLLHMGFLTSIDVAIFAFFNYVYEISEGMEKVKWRYRFLIYLPLLVNCVLVVMSINSLEYRVGKQSNYSMGIPAYTCYITGSIYVLLTVFVFYKRWNYMEREKRRVLLTVLLTIAAVMAYQMFVPDALITSLGFCIMIVMIYANMENPSKKRLDQYHQELIQCFANVLESRDGSTGGHVKRTSAYVNLLAEELNNRGLYTNILTKDYILDLSMAAMLHDIGKIAIPDRILLKPGKLTKEEFEIMKTHSEEGGKLIRESLSKLGDEEYIKMAYDIAMYHHERWDGKGYPSGLSGRDIPLSARIMAVADVFDALAEKRCYRDAMPIEKAFQIIEEGKGTQFETEIVECFLDVRKKVEKIHDEIS